MKKKKLKKAIRAIIERVELEQAKTLVGDVECATPTKTHKLRAIILLMKRKSR